MLGKKEIKELVDEKNLIQGFDKECLEGAGYDLRLNKIYELDGSGYVGIDFRDLPKVREIKFDEYPLNPGEYVLIETLEKVNMPLDIAARVLPRSTVFRCGASLITALVDPGYRGTLTMGLYNQGKSPFRVQKMARIAQIMFEPVRGKTKAYDGRYQGGKVV